MSSKKKIISVFCMLLLFAVGIPKQPVYAEAKQTEIITASAQEDLTVLFTFDNEIVDITFISPSGDKKTADDSDVEYAGGDLWSTYRISNAAAGTWSVEYDLGGNTEIIYSVIEDDYGLWIQYLNIKSVADDKAAITFEADFDSESIYYDYEVYALSTTRDGAIQRVSHGSTKANAEKEIEIRLSELSSDNYVFRLDVYYKEGGAELFDSAVSEAFDYFNPNEPDGIENYKVKVDADNLTCTVDWSDYAKWSYDGYRLIVNADGETIYTGDLDSSVTINSILFAAETTILEIKLSYKDNDTWSAERIKTIVLNDEQLSNTAGEVTNSVQLPIRYKVNKGRLLYVNVNGGEGTYKVKEEGTLSFDLAEGINAVYAEIESDDLVFFVIDTDIYCDVNPPEIKLYDDLDGKTFIPIGLPCWGKCRGAIVCVLQVNQ